MKPNYMLIAHYVCVPATILAFDWIDDAYYHFQECKLHPDLAFAILYSKHPLDIGYTTLESFVNQDQRRAYEFTLLGFDKPITPAGQE